MKRTLTHTDGSIEVLEGTAEEIAEVINKTKSFSFIPSLPSLPLQPQPSFPYPWTITYDTTKPPSIVPVNEKPVINIPWNTVNTGSMPPIMCYADEDVGHFPVGHGG